MKKALITTVLVLGCATSASADVTYTLGETTYTTTTGIARGADGAYRTTSVTFTLTNDWFSGTKETSNVLTTASDGSTTYASSTAAIALTSISFLRRSNNEYATATTIKILDSENNVVATSTGYTDTASVPCHDIFSSSTGSDNTWTRSVRSWTFAPLESILNVGSAYTIKFYNESNTSVEFGISVSSSAANGYTSFHTHETAYQPAGVVMSYTSAMIAPSSTDAIPEPATATLSLLALAGLAARRRRK